jgi:Sulfotransferase domain
MSAGQLSSRAELNSSLDGRLPNLVIIGVGRAATTSLFNHLGRHPDIGASDVKELRYFSPLRYGETLGPIEEYARHFRHCGPRRYLLEATPGYFYGGRRLATAMVTTLPDVKAMLSLRAPEERCWSWFRFVRSRLRVPQEMSFEEYLDRCEALRVTGADAELENQEYWGLSAGCYAEWLPDWLDVLGDRLHLMFLEDLSSDPDQQLQKLCRWLGLDHAGFNGVRLAVENEAVHFRDGRFQKVAIAVNRRGEAMFRRHPAAKRRLRALYYGANRSDPTGSMLPATRERLEDFYHPHTRALVQQLAAIGQTLPASWRI